jgi:predicted PurR-regulated permease PerM
VLTLDDRTGNVLTTVAVFAAAGGAAFAARTTLVVFVLALLLAYLLEPMVAGIERLLPSGPHGRGVSIAVVYGLGALLVIAVGYGVAPTIVDESRRLNAALPDLAARIDTTVADHGDLAAGVVSGITRVTAAVGEHVSLLLMVPIVAIFFLDNRAAFLERTVDLFAHHSGRAVAKRTIQQIDRTLAEYTRAQLILAALSGVFYGVSMALFGFPYPLPLAIVGGALEFVPVAGWIIAAAAILVSGWFAHAHWIWMAAMIVGWRILQNFVISPRVMGDRLQMEPLMVLFALMVGGQVGGLAGVILSLPAVAVFRIVRTASALSGGEAGNTRKQSLRSSGD